MTPETPVTIILGCIMVALVLLWFGATLLLLKAKIERGMKAAAKTFAQETVSQMYDEVEGANYRKSEHAMREGRSR